MGGTYYSKGNSHERKYKNHVGNSRNYLLDHTGNSFRYESQSTYQKRDEEGDSWFGEITMIEFDPKKVINARA